MHSICLIKRAQALGCASILALCAGSYAQCEFAQHWTERNESAGFAKALATGSGLLAIGAPRDSTAGTGFGSVTIYTGPPALPWTWSVSDLLTPVDVLNNEEFGWSVGLDGNLLAVGARKGDALAGGQTDTGMIYLFQQELDATWTQLPLIQAQSPQLQEKLGETIGISGTTIVAGSLAFDDFGRTDSGRVVVFEPSLADPDQWVQVQSIIPATVTAGAQFGAALAISGDTMIVGAPRSAEIAPNAGAAFLYERDTNDPTLWNLVSRVIPPDLATNDQFGWSVDTDGQTVVIGARQKNSAAVNAGRAYVYRRSVATGEWLLDNPFILDPPPGTTNKANFGTSVAIQDGIVVVGAPALIIGTAPDDPVGMAHVFLRSSPTQWLPGPVLRSPDNLPSSDYGSTVAYQDGLLIVGDPDWGPDAGAPPVGYGRSYWNLFIPGEGDCDSDGISDGCEVALGLSQDCDVDGIPDSCSNQPIAVWTSDFKGVFSDPDAWCDQVPTGNYNAIFNRTAPDGLPIEVITIRSERVRGLEIQAGRPRFLAAGLGSLDVIDTVDAFNGFPLRLGSKPGTSKLDLEDITITIGDDTNPGSVMIAPVASSVGVLLLDGPSTFLDVSLDVVVGDQGVGSLKLKNGAMLKCQELRIGSRTQTDATGYLGMFFPQDAGVPVPSLEALSQIRVQRGIVEIERQCVFTTPQLTIEKDGVVRSDAIIDGSVFNIGTLKVLNSPRRLLIRGDYRQVQVDGSSTRIGRLRLGLGTGVEGASHDFLDVTRTVELAGGLSITALPSFDPPVDRTPFEIVHGNISNGGGTLNGRFSVATFPGLSDLKFLRLEYDRTNQIVRLVVDSLAPDQDAGFGGSQNYAVGADVRDADLGDVTVDPSSGFVDLVVIVGGENQGDPGSVIVFTNDGTPDGDGNQFVSQTTISLLTDPMAVAVGELDNDPNGLDDIAVANADGSVTVLRTLGTNPPTFATLNFPGVLDDPRDIQLGDIDEDTNAREDLVVVGTDGAGNGAVVTRLNLGGVGAGWAGLGLQLTVDAGAGGLVIADIGDLDNDKIFGQDLAAMREDGSSFAMCANLGGGSGVFWQGLEYREDFDLGIDAVWMDIGDLDNDKDFDLIASGQDGDDGAFSVILNDPVTGPGAPLVFAFEGDAGPIVLANLDSDDDLDAAVAINHPELGTIVQTLRNDLTFVDGEPQLAFSLSDIEQTNAPVEFLLAGEVDATIGEDLVIIEDHAGGLPGRRGGLIASVQLVPSLPTAAPNCPADLTNDGVVDVFDVLAFLGAFSTQDPVGDWNQDGQWDFFDIGAFLNDYTLGCS
jgi:T5SS/PEP-CTERM-associated repeat protein